MNMNLKQRKKPNMDCINLLTSILLCYPEISEISVEPEHEEVYISYTVDRILNDEDLSHKRHRRLVGCFDRHGRPHPPQTGKGFGRGTTEGGKGFERD